MWTFYLPFSCMLRRIEKEDKKFPISYIDCMWSFSLFQDAQHKFCLRSNAWTPLWKKKKEFLRDIFQKKLQEKQKIEFFFRVFKNIFLLSLLAYSKMINLVFFNRKAWKLLIEYTHNNVIKGNAETNFCNVNDLTSKSGAAGKKVKGINLT